jgi:hypothetical protein
VAADLKEVFVNAHGPPQDLREVQRCSVQYVQCMRGGLGSHQGRFLIVDWAEQ